MSCTTQELISKIKSIFTHRGFRRYFANTSWMFVEQILRIIAGLFVGIYVARYLGPVQFGNFSYAITFAVIFGGVAKLGLDGIVVLNLVNSPGKRDVYLGTAFWLKLAGAILTFGIVAIATLFTSNDSTINLYIFIIASGLIFQSFEVIDFYFQSKVLSKFVSICKITQLLLSSILKLYFVYIGSELFWFVFVSLIDQITLAITLYFAYRNQKIGNFYRYFDVKVAKGMLKSSWPIIIQGFLVMMQARIDQLMIHELFGSRELGIYSAALRIIEAFTFIPVVICNSLSPALTNAKKIANTNFYTRLSKLYSLMLFLFLLIAVPILMFSNFLISISYGKQFMESSASLCFLLPRLLIAFYGVVKGLFILNENLFKYSLISSAIGALLNICLNYLLIPIYSINGAIISSSLSFFTTVFLLDFLFHKTRANLKCMVHSLFIFRKHLKEARYGYH